MGQGVVPVNDMGIPVCSILFLNLSAGYLGVFTL